MEDLRMLRQQVERKKHLEGVVSSLEAQRQELERKARVLDEQRRKEQLDVEKLEGKSLAAFFGALLGMLDEKLDRERQEAYAAAVKYDAAARELADVEDELDRRRADLNGLQGCEARYQQQLIQKRERMKASGGADAAAIADLEASIGGLDAQLAEIREAVAAGRNARGAAEQVLSSLDSAEGWSTLDVWGGGLISDMMKHDRLLDAQRLIGEMQVRLRQFRTELVDVTIQADVDVRIDGLLDFADFFFDNIFADLAVRDKIRSAQGQVKNVWDQICDTLGRLATMEAAAQKERADLQARLDALVVES